MRNMVSFDACKDYIADYVADTDAEQTTRERRSTAAMMIKRIIAEELTARQREMCVMYYFQKLDMPTIGAALGVNKSTVCRTIARGLNRVNQRLKYYRIR